MNRQTRFVIALLLGLLCFGCGRWEKSEQAPEKSTAEKADWLTDFETAQAQARAEKDAADRVHRVRLVSALHYAAPTGLFATGVRRLRGTNISSSLKLISRTRRLSADAESG